MPNPGNHSMGKGLEFLAAPQLRPWQTEGRGCFKVQVEQAEGTVEEISGKEDLHEAIRDNTKDSTSPRRLQ